MNMYILCEYMYIEFLMHVYIYIYRERDYVYQL